MERMSELALHTAPDVGQVIDLGRHLFRKQLLRTGEFDYRPKDGPPRKLRFTPAYLASLATAFKQRAVDQVPFQLADGQNSHDQPPERFHGEVLGMELSQGGEALDVLVSATDEGAKVLEENPRLGISARILEDYNPSDGRHFDRAVDQVLGTLRPVITGLSPWAAIKLADPARPVIDLSEGAATMPEITEERRAELDAYLTEFFTLANAGNGANGGAPDPNAGTGGGGSGETTGGLGANGAGTPPPAANAEDAELEAYLREVLAEGELADANLSEQARAAITLANSRTASLEEQVGTMRSRLAQAEFEEEKRAYVLAGVPPADVDLAMPLLLGGPGSNVIELSRDHKVDAGDIVRRLLDSRKGTVNLSREHSLAPGQPSGDAVDKMLTDWERQFPTKGRPAPANNGTA
jgi:hypothetical protein